MDTRKQPWAAHYPSSVPASLSLEEYTSLTHMLQSCCKRYGDKPMLENMGKVLTYREVNDLSEQMAAYLQRHTRLQAGDRVAIQLPNLLQYPVALFGILKAGMVVVNVNPLYTPYETLEQLNDAQAKGMIVLENFAHNLAKIESQTSLHTILVTGIGDLLGMVKRCVVHFIIRHVKRAVPPHRLINAFPFAQALKIGAGTPSFSPASPRSFDIAFLQYTGGTTGTSKGAVLTHANVLANITQMRVCMQAKLSVGDEVAITPLPLYHIFSLVVNLLTMIQLGAKNVLITNPRDLPAFIKELKRHPFTFITGVNTLFRALLANASFRMLDFSRLKVAVAGGVALQEQTAKDWEKATGVPLVEGYGLTEASPVVASNMVDGTHRLGTVGIPVPHTLVKIVDAQGKCVAAGTPGELLVQGPQVMQSYWNKPDETLQVLKDGWLHTGDMATMSAAGFVSIVDRKKEMINVSGFNVYPSEIEKVLARHPAIAEVSALGVVDSEGRESVRVYVVRKDDALSAEAVIAHCREHLTKYKVPKQVVFKRELPKSAVGKVLKRVLAEEERSLPPSSTTTG